MSNGNATQESRVHATALVDPTAVIGEGVEIGPYSVVGPNVELGAGTRLGAHVVIERDARLGRDCRIHSGAVLAGDPQDLKFGGEVAPLVIGDRTVVREFATLNRGTHARGRTQVGDDCLIMA
ncbi:MAG TPA: acyl-[acyl-carrier-protein]--UDP-N-acetylglucosamine O-acyltransferase, partial [Longimicrobiales bacterium]|nr:acyl-[acyl-carrier-protein]--UDP-N-acetylglucosamine O-acyltransferase [Longimicrobiales bacterium]